MDKIFVLDNFKIVLDKKYFVWAEGGGMNRQYLNNVFNFFCYLSTLTSLIIMQQILLIFWKIPTCTPLFQPALLLIFGNY